MAANRVVAAAQGFCSGFVRGFGENVNFVGTLIQEPESGQDDDAARAAQQSQKPTTELARRRAEKQRALGEAPSVPKEVSVGGNTRRLKLFTIITKNLLLCVVCVLGATHAVKPLMRKFLEAQGRDYWNSFAENVIDGVLVAFWLGPMWLMIKLVNIYWMTDLANDAYKERRGRPAPSEVTMFFSDMVYTTILQLFFILQITLFSMIPVSTQGFNIFEVVLTAISYSLYSFEYKWMNMGFDVSKRLDLIDKNLGYHIGFAFPLTILVLFFQNFWLRFILYSVFFPVLIVCANDASEPVHRRGLSSHVFHLPERATHFSFLLVKTLGLRRAVNILLGLLLTAILYSLGVLGWLLGWLPTQAVWRAVSSVGAALWLWGVHIRDAVIAALLQPSSGNQTSVETPSHA